MALRFGRFIGNGDDALLLLHELTPQLDSGENIVFDFLSCKNMNDSFSNALFTNMVRAFGISVLENVTFKHCNESIKTMINSSLNLK